MSYWIFRANPELYRIDDRLRDPKTEMTWAVTRYHDRIQKGDTVFVWRAGSPRGICAVMEVEVCPYQPAEHELEDGYELPAQSSAAHPEHWAKCRITQRFPVIEISVIKKIDGLELFSFFSAFQQATNFSITRPEGSILVDFIKEYLTREPEPKREIPVKPAARVKSPAAPRSASAPSSPSAPRSRASVQVAKSPALNTVALLKCDMCGRFVVSTDTERHARELHPADVVGWKKVK
jgi:predicted RNA-binding protein with PUA-like domain